MECLATPETYDVNFIRSVAIPQPAFKLTAVFFQQRKDLIFMSLERFDTTCRNSRDENESQRRAV